MSHLHLPAEHSVADLVLAGELAGALGSEDLYVVWTHEAGNAPPDVEAVLREPSPATGIAEVVARIGQVVQEVWRTLTGPALPLAAEPRRQRAAA